MFQSPRVDPAELEACLRKVRATLPTPVFWLLGKAQSGKTSLIRALTGAARAEIGNGFRPCTRTAQMYPFPNEEECFLRFLDTRGLGEVDYDPAEDMRAFAAQAHVVVVVVKALDHAQQAVLEPLAAILKQHPDWPLLVAQTCLHEAYPREAFRHAAPYPFAREPWPTTVPTDLARSLRLQREWFKAYKQVRFVPLDFTLPEDGLPPEHYGLDALWDALEHAFPLGLRALLQETTEARQALREVFWKAARPHVLWHAVAAGVAGSAPLPLVSIPLVLAVQGKMCASLAKMYGQPLDKRRWAEITSALGLSATALLGRELIKLIPFVGAAAAGLYVAASTYALGRTLCEYFSRARAGDVPPTSELRRLYAREYTAGRARLRDYFQRPRALKDQVAGELEHAAPAPEAEAVAGALGAEEHGAKEHGADDHGSGARGPGAAQPQTPAAKATSRSPS